MYVGCLVAKHTTKRCYSLIDGVRSDRDFGPDVIEQVVNADDLAGLVSKAQQESHRPFF